MRSVSKGLGGQEEEEEKKVTSGQVLVAHACNPRYSGSKPAQANSSARSYLGKPFTKVGLVEWLKVKALSSNPSTEKKKSYI
jgi:hypothetical protein